MGGRGGKSKPQQKSQDTAKQDPIIPFMAQMQTQQAAQARAAQEAQRQALIESQKQSASSAAQQGQLGAQQSLAQAGIMQQARDIAAKEAQQKAYGSMGQSAVGEGFDINQAKQQQAANIAGTGSVPTSAKLPFYGYNQNQDSGATGKYANMFNLPKMSGLTFGGA
jgi:hypothetical protein